MNAPEYKQLGQDVEAYVRKLYGEREAPELLYHNLQHTESVVQHAQELGSVAGLDARALSVLLTSAWFHDVGHLADLPPQGHEERSIDAMQAFFQKQGAPDEKFVEEAAGCIRATQMPQTPKNDLEGLMCDADTYHLGTPYFWETNKAVKAELSARGFDEMTKGWREKTLRLLENHRFFSSQAQAALTEGKEENIARAKERLETKKAGEEDKDPKKTKESKELKRPKDSEEDKEKKREEKKHDTLIARGIQTGLKLASENHLKLSDMADGKANILISVNSIIIGVILSVLVRRLEVDTFLIVPTMIFLGSSVATIILAIFSTLPNLTTGRFTREDVMAKKVNLLFFGNFYRSTFEEYTWAMNRLLADKDYLYGSLVKDIYFLGKVLKRKYTLIRWAYYVFMIGLIASVIAFVLAISLHKPDSAIQVVSPSRPPL